MTNDVTFEVEERIQCNTSAKVLYKTRRDCCLSVPVPLESATNFAAGMFQSRFKGDIPLGEAFFGHMDVPL